MDGQVIRRHVAHVRDRAAEVTEFAADEDDWVYNSTPSSLHNSHFHQDVHQEWADHLIAMDSRFQTKEREVWY